MVVPFRDSHDLLDVGAEIVFEGAPGAVFQVRPEGYLIYWTPVEGEAKAGPDDRLPLLTREAAIRASAFGRLTVTRRAGPASTGAIIVPRERRTAKEMKRMHFRKAHCQAAWDLHEHGMPETRAAFAENQDRIALGAGNLLVALALAIALRDGMPAPAVVAGVLWANFAVFATFTANWSLMMPL